MNPQQLDKLYNEKIKALNPFIITECGWDDDAIQEQCIGVYEALAVNPSANNLYLKNKARWNMTKARKKGRSVDNGFWKRNELEMVHCDQFEDREIAAIILKDKKRKPVDEQVINKIALERFFEGLSKTEKMFIRYKMEGAPVAKITKKLKISKKKLRQMKGEIS